MTKPTLGGDDLTTTQIFGSNLLSPDSPSPLLLNNDNNNDNDNNDNDKKQDVRYLVKNQDNSLKLTTLKILCNHKRSFAANTVTYSPLSPKATAGILPTTAAYVHRKHQAMIAYKKKHEEEYKKPINLDTKLNMDGCIQVDIVGIIKQYHVMKNKTGEGIIKDGGVELKFIIHDATKSTLCLGKYAQKQTNFVEIYGDIQTYSNGNKIYLNVYAIQFNKDGQDYMFNKLQAIYSYLYYTK